MAKKDTGNTEYFYEDFDIDGKGVLTAYTGNNMKITVPEVVKVIGPQVFYRYYGYNTRT